MSDAVRERESIADVVRSKYGERASEVLKGEKQLPVAQQSCCGGGCGTSDPITGNLYNQQEQEEIPADAMLASLGCGNPTALAALKPGQVVLDLGSGGGIDVLLSAKRVAPDGFACGLDMTDEMLELANRNKKESGLTNVEFLKGEIEDIPLPNDSVDVIISNCVINLSADKPKVIREAFRVLKPGGMFAVSDVVTQGELPDDLKRDMEAWVGCVAGALDESEYVSYLEQAGFGETEIQVTREYDPKDLAESMRGGCCGDPATDWDASAYERYYGNGGKVVSAFVRATKPA